MKETILSIRDLSIGFKHGHKFIQQTRDVSFDLYRGEILGLVGESGSGKSITSKAILQLLPPYESKILSGSIWFNGEDLLKRPRKKMVDIRGNRISMIFQEPMTSLNPVFTCGNQIAEAIQLHQHVTPKEAMEQAVEMMRLVGIPLPEARIKSYPHEMSGGMRQRVMIAMALSCNPDILIADEPTTALDPTIQAQIMEVMMRIREEKGLTILYISHDLGVIAEMCDRVCVMYAGTIMETANAHALFHETMHPYTLGLLRSVPRMDSSRDELETIDGAVPRYPGLMAGCPFAPRCKYASKECSQGTLPPMKKASDTHEVRCLHAVSR